MVFLMMQGLITTKPVTYLINMSAEDFKRKKNKFLAKIHAWVQVVIITHMSAHTLCLSAHASVRLKHDSIRLVFCSDCTSEYTPEFT